MAKRRILLVDDEERFARLVQFHLEDSGRYEVRTVARGTEALAAAREFRPDMVLLDVIMPDVDGATVASQIKEDPILRNTPIVFLTAIVSKEEVGGRQASIGGHDFLAKPVTMSVILNAIDKHLGGLARAGN